MGSENGRVYSSADGGASWTELTSGDGGLGVSDLAITSRSVYTGFSLGVIARCLHMSDDDGDSWDERAAGTFYAMAQHPTNGDELVVCGNELLTSTGTPSLRREPRLDRRPMTLSRASLSPTQTRSSLGLQRETCSRVKTTIPAEKG